MQVSEHYYDEIFDFLGQWDMPSRCGLKIVAFGNKKAVIVTELYQDNPGSSVTYTGHSLAQQICAAKGFNLNEIIYIECNPNMQSKLSFYEEELFEVTFHKNEEIGTHTPQYRKLDAEESRNLF